MKNTILLLALYILLSCGALQAQLDTIYFQQLSFNAFRQINHQSYQHMGDDIHAFTYQYDVLNRLKTVETKKRDAAHQYLLAQHDHDTKYEYDLNGNLFELVRYGVVDYNNLYVMGLMDSLLYTYSVGDNRLLTVRDVGANSGYLDYHHSGQTFDYDANGATVRDHNLLLSTTYNLLEKTDSIKSDTGGVLVYIYDATGLKIGQQQINALGNITFQKIYNGDRYYEKNGQGNWKLQRILHGSNAYIVHGTILNAEYHVADYLGNTQLSLMDYQKNGLFESGDVTQQQHYYPFGMEKVDLNTYSISAVATNPHKYNGNEPEGLIKQRMEEMELPIAEEQSTQMNTFYRTLSTAIGRWGQIDPYNHERESGYVSMANNPVFFSDPLGDCVVTRTGSELFATPSSYQKIGAVHTDLSLVSLESVISLNIKNYDPNNEKHQLFLQEVKELYKDVAGRLDKQLVGAYTTIQLLTNTYTSIENEQQFKEKLKATRNSISICADLDKCFGLQVFDLMKKHNIKLNGRESLYDLKGSLVKKLEQPLKKQVGYYKNATEIMFYYQIFNKNRFLLEKIIERNVGKKKMEEINDNMNYFNLNYYDPLYNYMESDPDLRLDYVVDPVMTELFFTPLETFMNKKFTKSVYVEFLKEGQGPLLTKWEANENFKKTYEGKEYWYAGSKIYWAQKGRAFDYSKTFDYSALHRLAFNASRATVSFLGPYQAIYDRNLPKDKSNFYTILSNTLFDK